MNGQEALVGVRCDEQVARRRLCVSAFFDVGSPKVERSPRRQVRKKSEGVRKVSLGLGRDVGACRGDWVSPRKRRRTSGRTCPLAAVSFRRSFACRIARFDLSSEVSSARLVAFLLHSSRNRPCLLRISSQPAHRPPGVKRRLTSRSDCNS